MTAAAAAAVQLRDLTVAYRGHPAVQHLSGRFEAGTATAVVGPNGAGKSTLLAAILGRVEAAGGQIDVAAAAGHRIAWLPQQLEIDRSFPLRVFDFVALGRWHRTGFFGSLGSDGAEAVLAALGTVGLEGFERRLIGELSAGQFQRVLFARVLVQDAPLILLDEPFNAIDARTTADLLAVMRRWHGEGRTVIAVLHDLGQVRENFEQTLLLSRECVAWGPTAEVLTADNLARARQHSEAWDDAGSPYLRAA